MKPASEFVLSSYPENVTVKDIRTWIELKDDKCKKALINFIYHRIYHRYIAPLENIEKEKKSGFLMMAISCLTIEALESFHEGINNTRNRSGITFHNFFKQYNDFFPDIQNHSRIFYKHIRCGILHQAETTGGWRISRDDKDQIFSTNEKVINANKFMRALKLSLDKYINELKNTSFDSLIWKNSIKKIEYICQNCK